MRTLNSATKSAGFGGKCGEGVGGDPEAQRKEGRKELRRWVGGGDWSIERRQGTRAGGGGELEKQRETTEGCGRGKGLRGAGQ